MKKIVFISLLFFGFNTFSQVHTGTGPSGNFSEDKIFCESFSGSAVLLEKDFLRYHRIEKKDDDSFQQFINALIIQKSMENIELPIFIPDCDCNDKEGLKKLKRILKLYQKMDQTKLVCAPVVSRINFIPKLEALMKLYEEK